MTPYIILTLAVLVIGILAYFRFESTIQKLSATFTPMVAASASSTPISPKKNWPWIVSGVVVIAIVCGIYLNHLDNVAEKKEIAAKNSAASAPNNWKLCWQKPEGYTGLTQTKSRCDTVEVKFIEQGFQLEIAGGMFSITGKRVDENSYKGTFQNKAGGGGDIFLKFSPDFKLATGWQKDSGSQEEVYTWLTR